MCGYSGTAWGGKEKSDERGEKMKDFFNNFGPVFFIFTSVLFFIGVAVIGIVAAAHKSDAEGHKYFSLCMEQPGATISRCEMRRMEFQNHSQSKK